MSEKIEAPRWVALEHGEAVDHAWATHRLEVPGGWLYRFTILFFEPPKKETVGDLSITTGRIDRETMVFVPYHPPDHSGYLVGVIKATFDLFDMESEGIINMEPKHVSDTMENLRSAMNRVIRLKKEKASNDPDR